MNKRIQLNQGNENKLDINQNIGEYEINKVKFTKEMKEEYTILIPQMAPIHFELLESALKACGYKVNLLTECTQKTIEIGLKYVNNDACYPSIITTGQMIEALESGKYDINKTALVMSQTGGGCRATNYIGFIRKALRDAGFENIPVISFNVAGLEKNSGFKITISMVNKLLKAIVLGDVLQRVLYRNRPYEKNIGETKELYNIWLEKCKRVVENGNRKTFIKTIYELVEAFDKIELDNNLVKPKVGIVGEILIKYHPFGNSFVTKKLEEEGAEVILPDFMGFVKYVAINKVIQSKMLKIDKGMSTIYKLAIDFIEVIEKDVKKAFKKSKKEYLMPTKIWHLSETVSKVLSTGNQTGEGWFLTAEMLEYIENGIQNIICVQPFACLPNHVVGKGVIKTIRDMYPKANIVPVDYDPGASETNQTNRIKLLVTVAKDNLETNKM